MSVAVAPGSLIDHFEAGLDAPICLTWELTYACNLACVRCLSSSGRPDPRELSTEECKAIIDELQRMQVFYVSIGGGEPTVRRDFWELLDYATAHDVGVKFSTNGSRITPAIAAMEHLYAAGFKGFKISVRNDVRERVAARRVQGHRRPLRGATAHHAPPALGAWRRRVGPAAPDGRPAA